MKRAATNKITITNDKPPRQMNTYRLWQENRLDQEYTATRDELIDRLKAWLEAKGIEYVHSYNTEQLIRFFLTDKEGGMNSVFEEGDFPAFIEDLRPIIMQYEKATAI